MCNKQTNLSYASLGNPNRIWAIPAVHAQLDSLIILHDEILGQFEPGDRIVYMGNFTGYGDQARETIDEILTFRRLVLSLQGVVPSDIVYLRGQQEEMLQKLLQLQFAPNPTDVYLWMLANGLSKTLASYGISHHDGIEACRIGTMGITKWTEKIRKNIRANPGHDQLFMHLSRAAHTAEDLPAPLLFVHAGLNNKKPILDQGDHLWWSQCDFSKITEPYDPFKKVVRGYDPAHKGMDINCVTATIDGGCGFGGSLICSMFDQSGDIQDFIEIQ